MYGVKRKDGEAYTNLLQLMVKFILFRCLIDLANFSQLLSSPITKITVLSLYKMSLSRNPTAGASIGEPRALVYTSRTAYVSYA